MLEKPKERAFRDVLSDFLELGKFRLNLLVLATGIFGYFLAGGKLNIQLLNLVIGIFATAFAAGIFNQIVEVKYDQKMNRTSDRPLAKNRISVSTAFVLGWILAAFGVIHLGSLLSPTAAYLALATLAIYIFGYTPMKLKTGWNTVVGAISGALPPLIGYSAAGAHLASYKSLFIFLLLFLWQMPHFIAINWLYREEYEQAGYKMWSNDDDSGAKSAVMSTSWSFGLILLAFLPYFADERFLLFVSVICLALLGGYLIYLSAKFYKTRTRESARKLFFGTLIYLPVAMLVILIGWK